MKSNVQEQIGARTRNKKRTTKQRDVEEQDQQIGARTKNQRPKKPEFDEDLDLSIGKNPLNKYVDEKDVEGVQDVSDVQTVVGSKDDQTEFGENENITPQTAGSEDLQIIFVPEDAEVLTSEDDGFVGQEDQEQINEDGDMFE